MAAARRVRSVTSVTAVARADLTATTFTETSPARALVRRSSAVRRRRAFTFWVMSRTRTATTTSPPMTAATGEFEDDDPFVLGER
jgi:hypothetical protein